ncbi:MAG: radical SAM protein [Rikenellaceae bacterium]
MTALFETIIFGPIRSRRLGISLGVNLLPEHAKICNFDCVYCECGSNEERKGQAQQRRFAKREDVKKALRETLEKMAADTTQWEGKMPDVITFAGNGEPTLHPQFEAIIDDTIELRNELAPDSKISVLSNATTLEKESVVRALKRIDNNILKIDSAIESTAQLINKPQQKSYQVQSVISAMVAFGESAIVQTMFLRGTIDGQKVDNTTEEEIAAWIEAVERIKPRQVMIYSIDRDTPYQTLQRVEREELERIAQRLRDLNIDVSVA